VGEVRRMGRAKEIMCFMCGLENHCEKAQNERAGCKDFVEDCSECKFSMTVNGRLYISPRECYACERTPLPPDGEVMDNFVKRKKP
jgi:hypothetical protein